MFEIMCLLADAVARRRGNGASGRKVKR
jgi:hypothetical protein